MPSISDLNFGWGNGTAEFKRILREPHLRSNTAVGTPSLVWHVAVWPHRDEDAHDVRVDFDVGEADINGHGKARKTAIVEHNKRRNAFIGACNAYLLHLQHIGRTAAPSAFETFEEYLLLDDTAAQQQGLVRDQSASFTIWWHPAGLKNAQDAERRGEVVDPTFEMADGQRIPHPDALCVRVRSDLHTGFATFTFYIDISLDKHGNREKETLFADVAPALWQGAAAFDVPQRIIDADALINSLHDSRTSNLKQGDDSVSPGLAEKLWTASEDLYEGVWGDFVRHFRLHEARFPGEVFASFRGLATSVRRPARATAKVPSPDEKEEEPYAPRSIFNVGEQEPSKVVKALWPFLRLVKPEGEHREFIACCVNGFRAIYVSALGAPSQFDPGDGARVDDFGSRWGAPGGSRPAGDALHPIDRHVRYTLLIKERHHRQQLGRLFDRINALGTYRFYALKDLGIIRRASADIRIAGQELDSITRSWNSASVNLGEKEEAKLGLCKTVEARLISLMANLDSIGSDAIGGLTFRISRARYYVETYNTRMKDLRIERIEGWVPYDEFARRRLYSIFDYIQRTGTRIDAVRQRLRVTMDAVQTSAILLQTGVQAKLQGATAAHTEQLQDSAKKSESLQNSTDNLAKVGVVLAAFSLASQSKLDEAPFYFELKNAVRPLFGLETRSETDAKLVDNFDFIASISISVAAAVLLLIVFWYFGRRWRDRHWSLPWTDGIVLATLTGLSFASSQLAAAVAVRTPVEHHGFAICSSASSCDFVVSWAAPIAAAVYLVATSAWRKRTSSK